MPRHYTDGPFGQLHYSDSGQGIPLILCHQAPMSQRQFHKAYPLLAARGVRAIGFDLPGFGLSDPPDFPPRIEDYASVLPALLQAAGLERAHLLGHHTGAQVATAMALAFPRHVLSLTLNGPLPMTPEERAGGLAYVEEHEKGYAPDETGEHLLKMFKARTVAANAHTDWADATRYVAEQLMGLGPFWYGHHAAFTYDHGAALKELRCPAMILTNTGDEIYHLAQRAREMRPDFAYVELEGGGVDIVDERPEAWADAVAEYVASQQQP